MQFRSIS